MESMLRTSAAVAVIVREVRGGGKGERNASRSLGEIPTVAVLSAAKDSRCGFLIIITHVLPRLNDGLSHDISGNGTIR